MITEIRRVTLQRLRQKQFPFTQDKRYLVNRQLRSGFSQRITILFIYALILLLGGLMLAILIFYSKANVISIITSFIYILGGIWLLCYLILKVKKLSN
ncbi:hypothetical protein IQ278_31180 [Tolypothrix sp. LEGE 11397]|nr:hypothetical protein [Tolypothrix sp. LEGE 11397]